VLAGDSQESIKSGSPSSYDAGEWTNWTVCVDAGTYTARIEDSANDGLCCAFGKGAYKVSAGDLVLGEGGDFEDSANVRFLVTDDLVVANVPPPPPPSPSPPSPPCSMAELAFVTDEYPGEVTWAISQPGGHIQASGSLESEGENALVTVPVCLPTQGWALLTVMDSANDGLCCSYGHGGYELRVDGHVIASGSDFSETQFHWVSADLSKVDDFAATSGPDCLLEDVGLRYRGGVHTAADGTECLAWDDADLSAHGYTRLGWPGSGLGSHNSCRNPGGEFAGPWCFTKGPLGTEQSLCSVPSCTATPTIATFLVDESSATEQRAIKASSSHSKQRVSHSAALRAGVVAGAAACIAAIAILAVHATPAWRGERKQLAGAELI